jgi:hypothetical protein
MKIENEMYLTNEMKVEIEQEVQTRLVKLLKNESMTLEMQILL